MACMTYYTRYTDANIILLEADKEAKLQNIIENDFPDVEYIFIEDERRVFHRTHYINEQLKISKTDNAVNIDVDTIVPVENLKIANDILIKEADNVMVIPYDGRCVCVGGLRADLFREKIDIRVLDKNSGFSHLMFGYISVGGAYMVNISCYKKCGWENENFTGWGPEDYERVIRLEILGHKPIILPGKIYHLNHPRGDNSGDRMEDIVLATKLEYSRVTSMMPEELKAYVKTWDWIRD